MFRTENDGLKIGALEDIGASNGSDDRVETPRVSAMYLHVRW